MSILIVEDDDTLREALADTLALSGFQVACAEDGAAALTRLQSGEFDLVVSDVQMAGVDGHELLRQIKARRADLPVVLMTAYGSIEKAVAAMRDGASDYLVKPFEAEVLIEMVSRFAGSANRQGKDLVAEDSRTIELTHLATRVAGADVTVMISGPSGSGKEVFARLIHEQSPRRNKPFVAINCAAIPETMLESVLFGYEKGAFTGAYQARAGKFEQAQGGTLLLDEISEMDLGLQAKLLRVLQEKEVERLGGNRAVDLDVRVLATTNRNLREEVAAGRFREDLFYRLNVFPLHLPPLRQRPADILPLARHFIAHYAPSGSGVALSPTAQQKLRDYPWPGNARELANVIQRALILCVGDEIRAADLQFEVSVEPAAMADTSAQSATALENNLKDTEQQLILDALRAEQGRRKEAAERLGISPRTLRYKLARLREQGIALPGVNRSDAASGEMGDFQRLASNA